MQIVKADGKYRVYGENVEVYDKLKPDFYQFLIDDNGPYIVRTTKPTITEKVYGSDQKKVEKCFKTYNAFDRSLGIMLIGDKGNGKTLFAKQLSIKMIEAGYPVINVTFFHPTLPTLMTQIDQECVFLFDEFEKLFMHDKLRGSEQNEMLSTFDGINMTKKMFIITCNSIEHLSQYIYNRPGRFHYSFSFNEPDYEEIKDYLTDNLDKNKCTEDIDKVTVFSHVNGLNYDCLRSLVFELNNGYSLVETFDDLNIGYGEEREGIGYLTMSDGTVFENYFHFTPFVDKPTIFAIEDIKTGLEIGNVVFNLRDVKYDSEHNFEITPDKFHIKWLNASSVELNERKDAIIRYREIEPKELKIKIVKNHTKANPLRRKLDAKTNESDIDGYEIYETSTNPFKRTENTYTTNRVGFLRVNQ